MIEFIHHVMMAPLLAAGETNDDTKIYRGQAFYKNYVPKDAAQIGGNKFTGTQVGTSTPPICV